jgi:hypothetical protein
VNLPWYKRALWLLVIYCILYVLISPLPEEDATLSRYSVLALFALVSCALVGAFHPRSFTSRASVALSAALPTEILDKTCVRLC